MCPGALSSCSVLRSGMRQLLARPHKSDAQAAPLSSSQRVKTSSDFCESSDRFDFPHALHSLSMTTAEGNASLARGPLESSDPHTQLRLGAFVRAKAHIRCAIQFLGPWRSACPPEKVHDNTAETNPDWPHDRSTPPYQAAAFFLPRFLPAFEALVRPLKDYSFDWLPNAIFRRNKPVQSRYGNDDPALN
jgi:hypothetical protein